MTVIPGVWVRAAEPSDAPAIRDVAVNAWWATYSGRMADETIERFLGAAYSEERIAVRIERHEVLVAGVAGGRSAIDAFAEVATHDDHLQLVAIYAQPGMRGRGLGTALIAAITAAHPDEDVAADVLLGNELAEPFYAARGFEPGDLLTDEIAGEPVEERRWWRRARSGAAAPSEVGGAEPTPCARRDAETRDPGEDQQHADEG
jgi:GNAT superfamily N-acetyltransferase